MKAIQTKQYGSEEQMQMVEVPQPKAGKGQVVVRIAATTFNPIDLKLTSGAMKEIAPLQFPFVPGSDFCGAVESVGEGVTEFKVGDKVFGCSATGGAFAEFIAIDTDKVAKKPQKLNDFEAASLGLVGQTALQALDHAGVKKGQTVLIQGAGGAVGSVAVQVAHHRGAKVIATAGAESISRLKEYGADEVIDYKKEKFEERVKGVDVVLDAVGGDVLQRSFGVLKPGGVLVAITQPPSEELAKKHGVKASMLQTQPSAASLRTIAELVDAGVIKPFIATVYPLSEIRNAWRDLRSEHGDGKIVFQVAADARRSAAASE